MVNYFQNPRINNYSVLVAEIPRKQNPLEEILDSLFAGGVSLLDSFERVTSSFSRDALIDYLGSFEGLFSFSKKNNQQERRGNKQAKRAAKQASMKKPGGKSKYAQRPGINDTNNFRAQEPNYFPLSSYDLKTQEETDEEMQIRRKESESLRAWPGGPGEKIYRERDERKRTGRERRKLFERLSGL